MAKDILILGAGYAGLLAALETRKQLTNAQARITLVNRQPYHQLITELHQPAAGSKPEKHVRLPLDKLLAGKDIDVVIGEVEKIHLEEKAVELKGNQRLKYDILVVALGSETEYFGIPGLKEHSFTLKSIADATRIREHIARCIEEYTRTKDASYLTFVVGGAGLTGIELVGEIADNLPATLAKHGLSMKDVQLLSVEAAPTILPGFPESLVERAKTSLSARGVKFLTGVPIVKVEEGVAYLKDERTIQTRTIIWTGGVRGHSVVEQSGLKVEPRGRAIVNDFLQAEGHEDVFVIGDSCIFMNKEQGRPYPPTAQISWQMGVHVGRQIYALLKGGTLETFVPHFDGTLASLGKKDAIGMVGDRKFEVKGKPASVLKWGSNMRYLNTIGGIFKRG
jgi:NADH dehydrogenase